MPDNNPLVVEQNSIGALTPKTALSITITIIFFLVVEYFVGWQAILLSWSTLSIANLLLALSLLMLSYQIRALRIYYYFNMRGLRNLMLCNKTTLNHNFLNNMLPMRSGELSLPLYLHRYFRIGKLDSVVTLFYFRLLDLHVLITLLITISSFLMPDKSIYTIVLLTAWLSFSFFLLFLRQKLSHVLKHKKGKFANLLSRVLESLPENNLKIFQSYFWTALNWIVKLSVFTWIFMKFADIGAFSAFVAVIFGDLTSVLPIHGVAGAGTYEAGILFGTSFLITEPEQLLASAINLHLFILSSSVVGVVLAVLIRHKNETKS